MKDKSVNSVVVYKYMPKEAEGYFFSAGLLRFTSVGELNDPLEGNFDIVEGQQQIIEDALKDPKVRLNAMRLFGVNSEAELMRKIQEDERYNRESNLFCGLAHAFRCANVDGVGALCLSRTNRSSLMWSHYAQTYTGVCVGFDENAEFFKQAKIDWLEVAGLYPVNYTTERPTTKEFRKYSNPRDQFLQKASCWRYEDEVRCFQEIPEDKDQQHIDLPMDWASVREVVFGFRMPAYLVEKIIQAVERKNRSVEFKLAVPSSEATEVIIHQIESNLVRVLEKVQNGAPRIRWKEILVRKEQQE